MKYKKAILGGTFDHFHIGHQTLLDTAFAEAEFVTIGLTTEKFYQNKVMAQTIEDYATREKSLHKYLQKNNLANRSSIITLTDIYGPALLEKNIEAIFVTHDTLSGAKKINEERKKIGFSELEIVLVPFVNSNDGLPITSERIRLGEISSDGEVSNTLTYNTQLSLPENMREALREPIGEVTTDVQRIIRQPTPCLIAVGDIVTLSFLKENRQPDIAIVDLKTQRESLPSADVQLLQSLPHTTFTNHPGTINSHIVTIWATMLQTFLSSQKPQTLLVVGEEDLLTLPVILLAPLDSLVIYGQTGHGAIVVTVTPEKKTFVKHLLSKFIVQTK